MGVLRSTKKVAITGFESTSHTTVGRVGYPLNHPGTLIEEQHKPRIEINKYRSRLWNGLEVDLFEMANDKWY